MPKFRKKPIVIEAEQWFPGKEVEGVVVRSRGAYGYLETPDGGLIIMPGYWLITDETGKSVCEPGKFERLYELIEEK